MLKVLHIGVAALFLAALAAAAHADVPTRQQSVLMISADSLGFPHLADFFSGFRSSLQNEMKLPVRIYSESMDIALFDSPAYRVQIADWYRRKYRDIRPDAILVTGQAPLQFLIESKLWPDVPTFFALASESAIQELALPANVTGQTLRVSLGDIVALAKQLFPGTTHLALVGNRPENESYRPFHAAELQALASEIKFVDLRGTRYENVATRLAALPINTVVYHTTLSDDGSGRLFDPLIALEALTRISNRPTLVDIGTLVGLGPVGGAVFLPAALGHQAALKVRQLLEGTAPAAVPVTAGLVTPVFDWRQLQRWHVPDSRVPAASEIRYYQPTVWQQYQMQIVGSLLIIACLSALSIALLIERSRRALAVSEARKRLAEIAHMNRNATASVYSAAIAHELNQPLAAILSNAEAAEVMLGHASPPLQDVREILADIQRDDRRASDLIVRMRNLLKPSEAHTRIADISAIVRDALSFIASEATVRRTVVKTDLTAEPATVLVDPVQMQQVLINLVLNSLDAMSAKPTSTRLITISTALLGKTQVEVVVRDTGTGFDANIERVFESFFTTKSRGMGLGLSITAAIVQSHGGAVQASNAPGGGACVRFQLPLKVAA
jgi:signal transduction histidine kinase